MQLILNQIRASVSYEIDMQHEGRNADIFRANFAGDPTVDVPKIYWKHTSQDVLVMEYIEGRRISDYFDELADLQTRESLANKGANVVLKQIFSTDVSRPFRIREMLSSSMAALSGFLISACLAA